MNLITIIVSGIHFVSKTRPGKKERESEVNREHCLLILYLWRKLLYTKKKEKNTPWKSVIKIIPFGRDPHFLLPLPITTLLRVVEGKLIFKLLKKLKNGADSERGYYK